MNAIAKRAYGTGTVYYHRPTNAWRIRTPGQTGQTFSGFLSQEAAEKALENAMRGIPNKPNARRASAVLLLRSTLRYALELSDRTALDLDRELNFVRAMREKRGGEP